MRFQFFGNMKSTRVWAHFTSRIAERGDGSIRHCGLVYHGCFFRLPARVSVVKVGIGGAQPGPGKLDGLSP